MAKNSANIETPAAEKVVATQEYVLLLSHGYGANLVFGEVKLEPGKDFVISQEVLSSLSSNSNFQHYLKVGIIREFVSVK